MLLLAATASAVGGQAKDLPQAVERLLVAADAPAQEAAAVAGLEALGPIAVPLLFEVLATGRLPARERSFSETQQEAARSALRGLGRTAVLAWLGASPRPREDAASRVVALSLAGALGRERDLRLLIDLATPPADAPYHHGHLQATFRRAVTAILERSGGPRPSLVGLIQRTPMPVRRSFVHLLTDFPTPASFEVMAEQLGYDRKLDELVLSKLWVVARGLDVPPPSLSTERVRGYLEHEEPGLVVRSVYTLGYLEDLESVDAFVRFLESPDPALAEAARNALQRVSDQDFGFDALRWRRWIDEERRWFEDEAPALFSALWQGDAAVVLAALNAICRHTLHRSELALELVPALQHPNPLIRASACAAMMQVGSPAALAELVWCLEDPEDAVRAAAHEALLSITGRNFPAEPDAWEEAFLD